MFRNNTTIVSFKQLKYFTLSKSFTNQFQGCTNLTTIVFHDASSCTGLVFQNDAKLENVWSESGHHIPLATTYLPYGLFWSCKKLNVVDINNITNINENAFYQAVVEKLICHSTTLPNYLPSQAKKIYVPDESVNDYKAKFTSLQSKIYPLSQYIE